MPYPEYEEETDAALKNCIHKCGSAGFRTALVKAVLNEHRQHQGDFFYFIGELMKEWSKLPQGHYDGRNKYAVEMSKEICAQFPRLG